jgi:aspartyl-tRNA(Asn)/glutamyl-tRNA(Gln) amidotransferase subunit A
MFCWNMLDQAFAFKNISDLVSAISTKEISPVELVDLLLSRIERIDTQTNSYISLNPKVREDAQLAERRIVEGQLAGPLCGIPVSIKDIILTESVPTTGGSKVFGTGLESAQDAKVVRLLRKAGAIVVGKTNLHEFAFGITSENEHFGPVRNPWDPNRVAGGSSGGSAAAVVAGLSIGSIGTDTRGSIRIPSSCCGATGLKPTHNRVSMEGVLPLSWTLDHVGPIGKSVSDIAILMGVVSEQADGVATYPRALRGELGSLKIGVCPYYFEHLDPVVENVLQEAIKVYEDAGAEIVSIKMETLNQALQASDIITRAEAVTIHDSDLSDKPECYGKQVRERLSSGYQVSGMELVTAERAILRTVEEFRQVFNQVDCLVAPTLPVAPPLLGTEIIRSGGRECGIVIEFVRLNAPQNVAGLPALALPCGFTRESLPVGMQLIAWRDKEELILSLGAYYQRVTDWHSRVPPMADLNTSAS